MNISQKSNKTDISKGHITKCDKPKELDWEEKLFDICIEATGNNNSTIITFETREDAAKAYNEYAKNLYGEFARLNVLPTKQNDKR
jgi:glyceraldehyde-3-phosphate dehydrogenase/erythrose-4-phosphate dehydrogenase